MQNSILDSLNPAQRAGVEATHGPVLVIAGAGSGKTRMLTARIAHLMADKGVPGQHILAVTFTNKAAAEMRERVTRALGLDPEALTPPPFFASSAAMFSQPTIGTFHAVCARILRREIERTPFTKQFVIYDDSDQLSLVKDCFSRLGLSDKAFSPKSFQWAINSAKCSALEPHEMPAEGYDYFAKNLAKIYALYQQELFKANAVDFGEMITLTYRMLRDNADLLAKYRKLFQFIHVDEYQDTNRAQYLLVKLLAAGHRNICVVGDEDQSIYKWRGADIRNILDFEKDYPEARVVKLEQNYRSTKNIIGASSKLISNNTERKAKTLWTGNEAGSLIRRFQVSDERAEAELVVGKLKQACESEGFSFNDVAVFYRTNAQSRVFEDILRRERAPYKIVGGLRFYDRKEIKDVMAYFRVLVNPEDSVSFARVINVPQRGIGKTTVDKIDEVAVARGLTFEAAMYQAAQGQGGALSAAPRKKISEFLALIADLRGLLATKTLSEFYHELLDRTRYVQELKVENTEESAARIENLQELSSTITEFESGAGAEERPALETLPVFLENVALVGERAEEDQGVAGSVSLMTLHMSKGLEFPLVFMVGMEEGLFPSVRGDDGGSDEDIEEERRLCYVGMTRAMKQLYMSHAVCRRLYGNILYNEPARFFGEIPGEFIEFKDLARFNRGGVSGYARDEGDDDGAECSYSHAPVGPASALGAGSSQIGRPGGSQIGRRVRHSVYGEGVIRGVEGGSSDAAKVTVEFSGRMTKKFILKFANLEYLS
ncbi:MAG: UvrD-helicase domain-containing protein [Deltaproteobacteria bacterium]|nr:UvrD-helicase domain-containing protein [Deltaproteobacteria bacterium]